VWINDGGGRFVDVAQMVGVTDRHDGRAVALADLGRRGVLDAVVANQRGPLLLYRNAVAPGRHWIGFALEGSCGSDAAAERCSNRSAIGAQAVVFWKGQKQVQEVSGGSGFCAQNDRQLHFGLGASPAVEKVIIRWPSGRTTEMSNPAADRVHKVKEPL
jgi:enediyne biosynthesis protein E4